jgi:1,4-dihydroxy-2-naphthoyl-CoA hydrolase
VSARTGRCRQPGRLASPVADNNVVRRRSRWQTAVMPAELDALVALMPFAAQLGVILEEASPDRVTARLPWAPGLCTAGGVLHGGVLMSLADSAGALVAFLGLAEGSTTATITSTTQMFRPVSSGTVRAVALPLHRGRTTVTVQTSLHDAQRRLVAQTTQVQAIR